jgi:hypothetical protein
MLGQKQSVNVFFLGYAGSAQMQCLQLMANRIAASQSTSGEMPDSGLDVVNHRLRTRGRGHALPG